MMRELFSAGPIMVLPIVAMFLFMAIFVTAAWSAWRQKAAELDALARLPLDGDERSEGGL